MKTALTALVLWLACATAPATFAAEKVSLINIDGAIGPATATYIARSIEEARTQNAQCLIIQLNTPGGLLDSTQKIVQSFLGLAGARRCLRRSDRCDRYQRRLFHHHCGKRGGHGARHYHWRGAPGLNRRFSQRRRGEAGRNDETKTGEFFGELHRDHRRQTPAQY